MFICPISIFQNDQYLPDVDSEGNITCRNCPESVGAGLLKNEPVYNPELPTPNSCIDDV